MLSLIYLRTLLCEAISYVWLCVTSIYPYVLQPWWFSATNLCGYVLQPLWLGAATCVVECCYFCGYVLHLPTPMCCNLGGSVRLICVAMCCISIDLY